MASIREANKHIPTYSEAHKLFKLHPELTPAQMTPYKHKEEITINSNSILRVHTVLSIIFLDTLSSFYTKVIPCGHSRLVQGGLVTQPNLAIVPFQPV